MPQKSIDLDLILDLVFKVNMHKLAIFQHCEDDNVF